MYTLVSTVALPKTPRSQWVSVNAGTKIVSALFQDYREVIMTLSHPDLEDPIFVPLEQLRNDYALYNNTLNVLLQVLGNYGFDTVPELPTQRIRYVAYSDLFQADYHLNRTIIGQVLPENFPYEDRKDLEITRSKYSTDLSKLHTQALISVNGFFHMTDTDGTRVFVVDGAKSCDKQNINHAGLVSFMDIAPLEKVSMHDVELLPATGETVLQNGLQFDVPRDLTNKSVFLVLGGYLVFLEENVFWQVNDQRFQINLKNLPYIERLLESNRYLDTSSLGLTSYLTSDSNLNQEEIWSDTVIRKYFQMSQSFLVVVNTPHLSTRKIYLKQMLSPGIFTAYQKPEFPLIVGYGRAAEYFRRPDRGFWEVTATDTYLRQYIFNHQRKLLLPNVHEQLTCYRPYFFSQGLLLEISTY